MTIPKVNRMYTVPSWKWIPSKTVTVLYVQDNDVCISIKGERGLTVVDLPATNDWELIK